MRRAVSAAGRSAPLLVSRVYASTAVSPAAEKTEAEMLKKKTLSLSSLGELELSEPVTGSFKDVAIETVQELEVMDGREMLKKNFLTAPKLVLTHQASGKTVEVLPLYHININHWYAKRIVQSIASNAHYSTVYLGSPLVNVKISTEPPALRSYSAGVSNELSFTSDFPSTIPLPSSELAPTFANIHTKEQYAELCTGKGFGGLPRLCDALKDTPLHNKDSICILTPPKGMRYVLDSFDGAEGWELRTSKLVVVEYLNRCYGLFLNGLARVVKFLIFCLAVYYIEVPYNFYQAWNAQHERDSSAKEIPVDKISFINAKARPEQDIALRKLQNEVLTCPPGEGVDNRVHNSFFHRELTWANVSLPKPLLPRNVPVVLKESGEVISE